MAAFKLSDVSIWVWIGLIVLAIFVAPIKMRILKKMVSGSRDRDRQIEDE